MAKGIHRVTSNSRAGRRMIRAKGRTEADDFRLTKEQREWNARIEQQRKDKKDDLK